MNSHDKIYIAGHNGMVGSAIKRALVRNRFTNLIYKSSQELDLRSQEQVNQFFSLEKPEYVFLAAARVGGIKANMNNQSEFLYENLMIELNVINASHLYGVKKLVFLGSSCIYPRESVQPMKEDYLLSGNLEPTNEGYALAKIAGVRFCETLTKEKGCNFISIIPPNLYGENDNFDLDSSHVIPALIRKFDEAKLNKTNVTLWGTGSARREFMNVNDCADACLFLMLNDLKVSFVNAGVNEDVSIKELAMLIAEVTGFNGEIKFDSSMPDGMPRKLMDSSRIIELGWAPKVKLRDGLDSLYTWFKGKDV